MSLISTLKSKIDFIGLAENYGYSYIKKKSTQSYAYLTNGEDKILLYYNNKNDYAASYYTTCNNPTDSGDLINFLINKGFTDNTTGAIKLLNQYDPASSNLYNPKKIASKKVKPFRPIKTYPINKHTYICHPNIGIRPGSLNNQYFQNRIFNGSKLHNGYYNTIFPIYHLETVIGQELRNIDFKHIIEGSKKSEGLWQSNPIPGATIFQILESPKDAMSYVQTTKTSAPIIFFSTMGSPSQKQIAYLFDIHTRYQKKYNRSVIIKLCGDNDFAGQQFNLLFILYYLSNQQQFEFTLSTHTSELQLNLNSRNNRTLDLINKSQLSLKSTPENELNNISITSKKNPEDVHKLCVELINIFNLLSIFSIILPMTKNGDFTDDLNNFYKSKPLIYA